MGLVALVDQILLFGSTKISLVLPMMPELTLSKICGWIFYPLTLIIGVPIQDAGIISKIIGERLIVTEVASYQHLAIVMKDNLIVHDRSVLITTYVLCGFAHVASMAIFIGGISAIVPEKTKELTQVGFRALSAATLACLLTGCVAGVYYTRLVRLGF